MLGEKVPRKRGEHRRFVDCEFSDVLPGRPSEPAKIVVVENKATMTVSTKLALRSTLMSADVSVSPRLSTEFARHETLETGGRCGGLICLHQSAGPAIRA